jgi:hypothetical protein
MPAAVTACSLTQGPRVRAADPERCFRRAIETARRRSARSLELRAVTSLARLWQARGEGARARRLLAPLCRWFVEGADTADLRAARQLLAALEASRPEPRLLIDRDLR